MKDIIYRSFHLMGVFYTKQYVTDFLNNHADENSLLCISDLFDTYKVENTALEFDDKTELISYPGAHIGLMVENYKSHFVVIESIDGNTITYYKEEKKITESLDEYFKKWQGFALFFTKKKDSAEPNYAGNVKKERLKKLATILYILSASTLFAALLYACWPIKYPSVFVSFLVIKLLGIGVSILLLSYSYSENSLLAGICNIGKKTNCSNILNSKAATVFSFLSWSEVGLFYFVATFLMLLITAIEHQIQGYYLLIGLNILALPYTVYSVYYQKKIAKSWCVLCLSVQAFLLLEFAVGLSVLSSFSLRDSIVSFITLLLAGVFTVTAWYLIKPLLESDRDLKITKKELNKFKQDFSLFQYALSTQPGIYYLESARVLCFGSLTPKVHFTIFTSPVCPHCSRANIIINKLLSAYPNEIAYTEIFAIGNDESDERVQIAAHMLQLNKGDKEYTSRALYEWHAHENREMRKWMTKYPVTGDAINETKEIIDLHAAVAKSLNITYTPTIAMNGKLLPELYHIEDLEKIIPAFLTTLEHSN